MGKSTTYLAAPGLDLSAGARRTKKIKASMAEAIQICKQEKYLTLKEKNKESAQRSRDNKKNYLVGLQTKLQELQLENQYLKKNLKQCKCSSTHPTEDSSAPSFNNPSSSADAEFERSSAKSFSCSNFLLLAVVCVLCAFGFLDAADNQLSSMPTKLYETNKIPVVTDRYQRWKERKQNESLAQSQL